MLSSSSSTLLLSPVNCADVAQDISLVWASEDKKEQKRRLHRIEMVQFRRKKKAKQEGLREEYNRLQELVKHAATRVKNLAAMNNHGRGTTPTAHTMRDLFVEIEDLRVQNVALRKEIGIHTNYLQVLEEAAASEDAQEEESILPPSIDELSSWRVRFPSGEPSFHFHPFTRDIFDVTMNSCYASLLTNPPNVSLGGDFLGWQVRHTTMSSTSEDHPLVAKSRFTKRICSSLLAVDEIMGKEDINTWPVIVTPMSWGVSLGRASTHILQEFDGNSLVLVRNVQGSVNLRYICFVQRHRWTERGEKRVITYTMTIADSPANRRNRWAEENDDEVQWITEGGAQLAIVEVDDGTVDVVYDHWGGCESALHAQYLFVQWAHYALRWEQMVVPSNLLPV
ncbi:hypothetical protein PHMEG_00020059 [Phytophthora megakarya]|uniref:Uncharacterized protein n=1 Tax=Phytophthora megakarya TaxID=4795 RepID=A0A225VR02_9STRA|nr:hypothetical protein PHMEG_00020059 [Phytophthora megakarya]